MSKKKNGKQVKEPVTPEDDKKPDVTEEVTEDQGKKAFSFVDDYNGSFSKKIDMNQRRLDIVRVRKVFIPDSVESFKDFIFDFGEACLEEGRNTFLTEDDCFIIIWETIDD